MAKKRSRAKGGAKTGEGPEALMRLLHARMEAADTAEALNDAVLIPFAAALEDVCEARGYRLNVRGERLNLVFSGDEADAEAIYRLVEDYLEKA